MTLRLAAALLALVVPAGGAFAAPAPGALTAAQVRAEIAGHSVAYADGSMTWWFHPNGRFEGDDGRNPSEGTYTVGTDGRLCWKKTDGIAGCFLYVRKGGALLLRRADPGHDFELGPVKVGPL